MGQDSRTAEAGDKTTIHLIQTLRGIAASMVVVHHASGIVHERLGGTQWLNGAAGVDIFFIVSGFVMMLSSQSLMQRPLPGREFIKRRAERIVPLYWIYTTLKIGLMLAAVATAARSLGGAWHVVSSYLFLSDMPVLAVGWTLNFEMFFYVLFAAALALKVRPLRVLLPLFVLALLVPAAAYARAGVMNWGRPIILEFLFGAALYLVYRRRKLRWHPAVSWVLAAAGFVALCIIPCTGAQAWRPVQWGLPALAIVSAGVALEDRLGRKTPSWLLEIGDASYSIYLSHTFVLHFLGVALGLGRLSGTSAQIASDVVLTIFSVLAGIAGYRLLERPMIHYFRYRRAVPVSVGA